MRVNFSHGCTQTKMVSVTVGLPQRSCESRNTAQKRKGDDDEKEGEEGWHVVTGGGTLSCYGLAFLSSRHITHNAATVCEDLNTDAHT